jgi:prefoldin subunit 5
MSSVSQEIERLERRIERLEEEIKKIYELIRKGEEKEDTCRVTKKD